MKPDPPFISRSMATIWLNWRGIRRSNRSHPLADQWPSAYHPPPSFIIERATDHHLSPSPDHRWAVKSSAHGGGLADAQRFRSPGTPTDATREWNGANSMDGFLPIALMIRALPTREAAQRRKRTPSSNSPHRDRYYELKTYSARL